jgi:hypothetical protein
VALAGVGAGANVSRRSGDWQREDYDVFDVGLVPEVGRIYRINAPTEAWWWGVSFELTGRKSYGTAATLDEAKAAFKAEYVKWKAANGPGPERYVISVDGHCARASLWPEDRDRSNQSAEGAQPKQQGGRARSIDRRRNRPAEAVTMANARSACRARWASRP